MNKVVSYDKSNDILMVHNGFSNDEKFKGNIDVGDIILDVSTKGRVRGIEIINAAEFLKDFEISKSVLENIGEANFNAFIKPGRIVVGLVVKAKNSRQEMLAKITVPLEIPVSC